MASPDLDALLNYLFCFAQETLGKQRGEFYPFGASMKSDGSIVMAAAKADSERPTPQELLDLLESGFRAQAAAGDLRACGICMNANVTRPGTEHPEDAIAATLEHQSGECVRVFLPYRKRRLRGYSFGDLWAEPGEPKVFATLPEGSV